MVSECRAITDLKPGDHLCCLYETEEEHRAVLTPFVRQGLDRGEKLVYIVDAHTAETVLGYLRDDGLKVEPYLARGQLNIITVDQSYMEDGVFDPDKMIALLRAETDRALAEGYPALRVTGEMTWSLKGRICDTLLGVPFIKFVFLGLIQEGTFEVKPAAWAGFEGGYLSSVKVTWDESKHGRGLVGTAIKTGQPLVVVDVESDPRFEPWIEEARKRGYASIAAMPLAHAGEVIGALAVYAEKRDAFGDEEVHFLTEVAGDIAIGIKGLRLEKQLEQSLESLRRALNQTVEAIASVAETRDPYTAGHQRHVAELSCAIGTEMGFSEDRIEGIRVAATVHDIGKMSVPAEILTKPGKLSETEFSLIKTHPQVGHDVLKTIEFPWPVAQIVLQHHERMDGSGYPSGISGESILLEARIMGVSDVVEAMSSHRPYRPAIGIDAALLEIMRKKGVLFDPDVVDVCLRLFADKGFKFE